MEERWNQFRNENGQGYLSRGGQFSADDNTTTLAPYSTLAFKAMRRLGAGFTLALAMENALNKRYQESATDLAPGRTGKAALTWEFR